LLSLNDENLASIAHDLRNPLAIVELETQHLQRLLRPLGLSAAQNSLERVNQNVTFMTALIDDILDLARSEAGRLRLELEPADLADMLTHLLGRAVAAYDRDRVVLDLRDRATARIDSARIQRVVENLVRNALAHAPARSRVIVRLEAQRDRAQISVIDSGPGLTPEEAESVFVRYWQGPATRDHQGQGLGLHVSRKIVEAHGGRLDVETTPGAGSRFFFELPVTRV
jgi:signal transduction histidine kinase